MPDSGTIADRLLWLPVGLAIATAGVVTLGGIVNHFAFDDGIPDLDAGREGSLNNRLILLVAAVVVDLGSTITRDLAREGTAWPQATRIAFEEGLEVSGWILASAALVTILCLALLERDEPGR